MTAAGGVWMMFWKTSVTKVLSISMKDFDMLVQKWESAILSTEDTWDSGLVYGQGHTRLKE